MRSLQDRKFYTARRRSSTSDSGEVICGLQDAETIISDLASTNGEDKIPTVRVEDPSVRFTRVFRVKFAEMGDKGVMRELQRIRQLPRIESHREHGIDRLMPPEDVRRLRTARRMVLGDHDQDTFGESESAVLAIDIQKSRGRASMIGWSWAYGSCLGNWRGALKCTTFQVYVKESTQVSDGDTRRIWPMSDIATELQFQIETVAREGICKLPDPRELVLPHKNPSYDRFRDNTHPASESKSNIILVGMELFRSLLLLNRYHIKGIDEAPVDCNKSESSFRSPSALPRSDVKKRWNSCGQGHVALWCDMQDMFGVVRRNRTRVPLTTIGEEYGLRPPQGSSAGK